MTKKLIFTVSVGEGRDFSKITHKTFKRYADRIGADFLIIDDATLSTEYVGINFGRNNTAHPKKIDSIYHFGNEYDRIIYLDDSCYISNDCPDLFSIVPENFVGMYNEGMLKLIDHVVQTSQNTIIKNGLKPIPYRQYFNSGLIVSSKQHQPLFSPQNFINDDRLKKIFECVFVEQTYLNYMVNSMHIPYMPLCQLFGKMYMFNDDNVDYADRTWDDITRLVNTTHDFSYLTKLNTSPGYQNHAFIYHLTTMWSNTQRLNIYKQLQDLGV